MGEEAAQPERRRSWSGIVRREIDVECRVVDAETRTIEVVASSEALDSHGDILLQHWDLSRYAKNPVVLWNHNIHESSPWSFGGAVDPEDTMPIGKADARVENKQLLAKITLVKGTPDEEPLADKLWRRIQQGIQRAVSVGFRPGQVTRILKVDGSTDHFELGSAVHPNELREISFVPMGSNPDAVAKSIAFEREHLGRMAANEPADRQETEPMSMTEAEQKALSDAQTKATSLERTVATHAADLDTEKKTVARLETELKTASERASKAEAQLAEAKIKALVGIKIAPTELDEQIALAKEIGIERVERILSVRPDMKLLQPVKVDGQEISERPQLAPPSTDNAGSDGSGDIAKEASAAPVFAS